MPTVRYGQRKVDLEALPGVRKTAAETPESMGAGVAQAKVNAALSGGRGAAQKAEALAGLGGQVAQIGLAEASRLAAEARQQADQVSMMAAKNQIARWETDRIYGDKGALTLKGKDAQGLPEQIDADFTATTGEIEKGLNPRQLAMFQDIKGQARENVHATVQRHVFGEMQAYAKDELQARIETGTNLAVANAVDFRRVSLELKGLTDDFLATAPQIGITGPAATQAGVDKIRGGVHSQVIEKMLSDGSTTNGKLDAQLYYDEAKGQITDPQQREKIEKALTVGDTRAQAQDAVAKILAEGGTPAEQRAAADKLPDRAVRDEARQRLEHEHAIQKAEKGQAHEDLLDSVYTKIHQSGGSYRPTPSETVRLGANLSAIDSYRERLVTGDPVKTDPATYYTLLSQAADDPAAFMAKGNSLLQYSTKLSDGDLKSLMRVQTDMRGGKQPKELDDHRTRTEIVNGALARAGLEPTPGDKDPQGKARVARFQALLAAEERRVQGDTNKEIDHAGLEAIANRLLAQQLTTKGWFGTSYGASTKSLSKATLADIPKADRAQLETALTTAGVAISDDNLITAWAHAQRAKAKP